MYGTIGTINGTDGNDFIASIATSPAPPGYNQIYFQGGPYLIEPGAGSDSIYSGYEVIDFGPYFDSTDVVRSLDGDLIILGGDYSAGLTITGHMMAGVGEILLDGGFNYNLTIVDSAVSRSGEYRFFQTYFELDATAVGGSNSVTLNAQNEKDVPYSINLGDGVNTVTGTQENDQIICGTGTNVIDGAGGGDTIQLTGGVNLVHGGSGNDGLGGLTVTNASLFGDAGDDSALFANNGPGLHFDGGSGDDTLAMKGDFPDRVLLTSQTVTSVEQITLEGTGPNETFDFAVDNSTLPEGHTLTLSTISLDSSHTATFDASAVTAGQIVFVAGNCVNHFIGGSGADLFEFRSANEFGSIDGGAGNDTLLLDGGDSVPYALAPDTIQSVELIKVGAGFGANYPITSGTYDLIMNDANVAAGARLQVNGSALIWSGSLTFDGSAETDGSFSVTGGSGPDTLTGGADTDSLVGGLGNDTLAGGGGKDALSGGGGNDVLIGGLGADQLAGGAGADTFTYNAVAESTGVNFDTIQDFDAATDSFDMPFAVTGINFAVMHGALSLAGFDTQLAAAIGANHLSAHRAILFTPDSGTLAGKTFLIVDANGVAGYQAGQDYVMLLTSPANLASMTTHDFR